MIGALLFLPASLLAAQITITEVSAEREGGRVAINVQSDAMIDPEATTTKLSDGQLYLSVYDAHVHENNRAWQNDVADGAEEIRAHRHKQRVELAIPLGDSGCQGPVELEKAAGGLRALVGCEGEPRPSAPRASRPSVATRTATVPETVPETVTPRAEARPESRVTQVPPAASPTTVKPGALGAALKAKLSLDPDPAPAAKPATVVPPMAPAAPVAPVAPVAKIAAPAPLAVPAPHDALAVSSAGPSSSGNAGVVLAGIALLLIAGAAFYFSRRRAVGHRRHIQIIETASLGPKRSLVVARVGDATMILGTSEAGITLLQSVPDADSARQSRGSAVPELSFALPAVVADPAVGAPDPVPPRIVVEEMLSGAPVAVVPGAGGSNSWSLDKYGLPAIEEEVESPSYDAGPTIGQAGLLSRLFRRGTPANDSPVPRFEDILEDSFEDQELRRKLALGLSGRVR